MSSEDSEVRGPHGTGLVDQWYVKEYAHGVMAAAQRGQTAIKGADLDDNGILYPILIRQEDLDDMRPVRREGVPADLRTHLEEQHKLRSEKIDVVRNVGGSDG